VGNVDNPASTLKPVTPIAIGEDALVNPESLPQESIPCGTVRLPVVVRPVCVVVERMLQVATPVVAVVWRSFMI
tara:strand:+ start:1790 stop:2011 length:222 start_codon:yes stop_codon:yes gene_type:complete